MVNNDIDILIDDRLIVIFMTFLQNLKSKPGILERFNSEIGVCYIPINVYALYHRSVIIIFLQIVIYILNMI